MPRIFPVIKKVITSGSPDPSGVWTEDATVDDDSIGGTLLAEDAITEDALSSVLVANPESATVDDAWSQFVAGAFAEDTSAADDIITLARLEDDATVDDVFASGLVSSPEDATADDALTRVQANLTEDGQAADKALVVISTVDVARSGTPDSDPMFDAWTDQAAPTVNHGNESLLVKGKTTVGSDERRAYASIDLTQLGDFTAAGTGLTYTFIASISGIIAGTLNWTAHSLVAKPFTESTINWNTALTSNQIAGASVTIATGAAATYSFTISVAELVAGTQLGRWLLLAFSMVSAAVPPTVTILSRDDATAGNRPKWSIDRLERG